MLLSHMRESYEDDIVYTMLPNPVDAAYILRQRKRPVGLIVRLRQCVAQLSDDNQFKNPQHSQLEKNISDLNNLIMICEALRATPIPPIYTHHTSRLLVFYLAVLPLALHGAIANAWVTLLATGTVGFAMLGLDEISHLLEQPFKLMPVYQLSKTSMLDVADAFCCLPPVLLDDATSSNDVLRDNVTWKPGYW
jgi:predicted membrane chloride channel (bestrophin family)